MLESVNSVLESEVLVPLELADSEEVVERVELEFVHRALAMLADEADIADILDIEADRLDMLFADAIAPAEEALSALA